MKTFVVPRIMTENVIEISKEKSASVFYKKHVYSHVLILKFCSDSKTFINIQLIKNDRVLHIMKLLSDKDKNL